MEDSKKKPVMIGVIVVCIIVAGLITLAKRGGGVGGGINDIPEGKMTWVKCSNPSCNAEYEMSEKQYYKELQERFNPLARGQTPLTCKKCGKDSLFQAVKCANPSCGIVFIKGIAGQNDFPDRCPKCGQSKTEEMGKKRMAGGQ
jgi:hypothetical protein